MQVYVELDELLESTSTSVVEERDELLDSNETHSSSLVSSDASIAYQNQQVKNLSSFLFLLLASKVHVLLPEVLLQAE